MEAKALYIHIPFCKKKCYYCDFPSFCGKDHLTQEYIKVLNQEISERASGFKIKTIFIGGGTPTFLNSQELLLLGEAIKKLDISEECEFTVECNPGTLTEEKLRTLKEIGVNRLSIGLQSTHDYHLKKIGRIHNYSQFVENYKLARSIGFDNINVDLIFGLPDESIEEWTLDLKRVIELKPEHISTYSLIIEEDTLFFKLYNEGKLNLPEEELERDMYRKTLELIKKAGYHQYEISNFSLEGKECRHNLVYWNLEDYIACGTGAHSYSGGVRYKNAHTIEEYMELMKSKGNPFVAVHENSQKDDIEEFLFMGMRKIKGISEQEFKSRFNVSLEDLYQEVLLKHEKQKLIVRENGTLSFTANGIEFSNLVLADFLL